MKQCIATALGSLSVFFLLAGCTARQKNPRNTPIAATQVSYDISAIPEDFRSEKLVVPDGLYENAAGRQVTAYCITGELLTDWTPLLEQLMGEPLEIKTTLDYEEHFFQEYCGEEGDLIYQDVNYYADGSVSGSGVRFSRFEETYYTRLITPLDSESLYNHMYTTDRFAVDADLSSFSCFEAKQQVIQLLNTVGLTTDEEHITAYTLTKDALQETAEERKKLGWLDPICYYDNDGNRVEKDPNSWYKTFSVDDECYYMEIGLPMQGGISLNRDASLCVYLRADGYLSFQASGVFIPREYGGPVSILSAGQAVSLLSQKYPKTAPDAEVYRMELVYRVKHEKGQFCLVPQWEFLVAEKAEDGSLCGKDYAFDATTGQLVTIEEDEAGTP